MDEKDRKIISILQNNGRETLSKVAREVGLSNMGAKKRIDKLIDKDVIRVKALINTEKLDIKLAIIAMELESSSALEKMLERFKECPRVVRFFVTTGSYNLFAIVFAEDYYTLESISLEKCSLRSQEGVRRFEFYPVQEIHYDPFLDLKVVPEKTLEYAPCGVYCGDCRRYLDNRCLGCLATRFYRGKL
jgi:DNA-binding Lrp family transcriptional regulator